MEELPNVCGKGLEAKEYRIPRRAAVRQGDLSLLKESKCCCVHRIRSISGSYAKPLKGQDIQELGREFVGPDAASDENGVIGTRSSKGRHSGG